MAWRARFVVKAAATSNRCQRVNLDDKSWTAGFVGGWGTRYGLSAQAIRSVLGSLRGKVEEMSLPGVSAPRGPRYSDEGTVRPNWVQAVAWAGIAKLEKGIKR
jgi:hypothetical protein